MKNRYPLLLLVVILALTNACKRGGVPSDQAFAYQDSTKLAKIVITDEKGKRIALTKADNIWKINDSLPAMPVKVSYLLRTIASLKIVAPVGKAEAEKINARIMKSPVRVELYTSKTGSAEKVYYVGEVLNSALGNYAVMELDGRPAAMPYIIGITNFVGDLQARYFTDINDWRDLNVFNTKIDDVKSVTIQYPYHPLSSFKMTVIKADSVLIEKLVGPTDTVPPQDAKFEDELSNRKHTLTMPKVNDFLNSFTQINAEAFDNEYYGKDTILNKRPVSKVYLQNKNGRVDSIVIYLMPVNKRTKMPVDEHGNAMQYDPDRYYALINHNKDFVVIQQFVFGKILRQRNDFYTFE